MCAHVYTQPHPVRVRVIIPTSQIKTSHALTATCYCNAMMQAPCPGVVTRTCGASPLPSSHGCCCCQARTSLATAASAPALTSAMHHPPQPAPVSRLPHTPACPSSRLVSASSSGQLHAYS
mmetsp:Transcript_7593/g.19175  ORF Transcript_7593/g.19175 Transcript_7593/m.19175 type:complete len:121 (-) Transcript_7593:244-606(-)